MIHDMPPFLDRFSRRFRSRSMLFFAKSSACNSNQIKPCALSIREKPQLCPSPLLCTRRINSSFKPKHRKNISHLQLHIVTLDVLRRLGCERLHSRVRVDRKWRKIFTTCSFQLYFELGLFGVFLLFFGARIFAI